MANDNSIWAKIDSVFSKFGAFVTGTRLGDRHLLDVAVKESTSIPTVPGGGGVSSGLTTDVSVNGSTWTALPPTPLTGRAGFSVQNQSGVQVKLNFATPAGYTGVIVENNGERFYDINDSGVLYCKSATAGPHTGIIVEELKP